MLTRCTSGAFLRSLLGLLPLLVNFHHTPHHSLNTGLSAKLDSAQPEPLPTLFGYWNSFSFASMTDNLPSIRDIAGVKGSRTLPGKPRSETNEGSQPKKDRNRLSNALQVMGAPASMGQAQPRVAFPEMIRKGLFSKKKINKYDVKEERALPPVQIGRKKPEHTVIVIDGVEVRTTAKAHQNLLSHVPIDPNWKPQSESISVKGIKSRDRERDKWISSLLSDVNFVNPKGKDGWQAQSLLSDIAHGDCVARGRTVYNWLYHGTHMGQSFSEHYLNIPDALKAHVNLVEDVCLMAHHLILSRNTFDRYIAIVNFCKLRGSRLGFTSTLIGIATDLFRTCTGSVGLDPELEKRLHREVCENLSYSAQSEFYEAQNMEHDNVFAEARHYLGMYDRLKETAIYKKLYKFSLYVLSLGLLQGVNIDFHSCNFTKFEADAIKRTHRPGVEMIHCMLDTVCFVCDRGMQYFNTNDPMVIFHSGASYEKWLFDAERLVRESKLLSNPEPHGISRFRYLNELKSNIEKGKSISKFSSGLERYEKMTIMRLLNELQLCESAEVTRKSAQEPRKDPFGILIHGSSSICKSQLKQILFYHYGKVFKLPTTADYMYTRSPADEFWSGFNSTQWCIVMDDIAFLKPNGELDPTLKELLQVKNSVAYVPPQADLCDKGRTPIRAELLIGTTNCKDLNLHAYFSCPFAVARRMSYVVTAKIKPAYAKYNIMADSSKIPVTEDGEYMNIWNFSVSIPIPAANIDTDNQRTTYKLIKEFTEINDFLAWYISEAKIHDEAQKKAKSADTTMMDVEVCTDCYRPLSGCSCDEFFEAQADSQDTESLEDNPTESQAAPVANQDIPVADQDVSVEDFDIIAFLQKQNMSWHLKSKLWVAVQILEHNLITSESLPEFSPHVAYWLTVPYYFWFYCAFYYFITSFQFGFWMFILFSALSYFLITYFWIIIAYCLMFRYGDLWKLKIARMVCSNDLECARLIFRLSGNMIKHKYYSSKHLRVLVAFLSSAVVLRSIYNMWRSSGMESQHSVGVVPKPTTTEKPTFYYHDPYKPSSVDISGESKCAQGHILLGKLSRATARFNMRMDNIPGKVHSTTAVNVRGNLWVFNKHAYKGGTGTMDIILEDCAQNVSRNVFGVHFGPSDIRSAKNSDLVIIELRAVPPGSSLLKYFPKDKPIEGRYRGTYVMRDRSGTLRMSQISNIHSGTCPVFSVPGYHGHVNVDTQNGDCGSICLADIDGSQVLLGSHTCGKTGKVFFQHISQRMLNALQDTYTPQVESGTISISAPGYERKLGPIHQKASVRFLEKGTVGVIGSFTGYRAKHKSKVTRTFIHPYVKKLGYNDEYGPPAMDWRPWHIAIKDMSTPSHTYNSEVLRKCEDAFFNDIVAQLGDKIKQLEVYNLDVALNGADGVTYVDQINKSTSAGNPFKKSKKNFMTVDDSGKITGIDDVIMKRIEEIEKCYSEGKRFHPQFCAHLKDEPVSAAKMKSGKTRVFMGGEFAWMLVVRKYFLSHIRLIQNNPFIFEAMPGIVAQSKEWQELHDYLTKFGKKRLIGGDYRFFDKRMCAIFVLAAFSILIRLGELAGWPEEDLIMLRCISYDVAYHEVDFNGDFLEFQGNPSGHPLTVIINCIVNSLYMRYAYYYVSKKPVSTFRENVNLSTYGDDNLMNVSPNCPDFTHTRIAVALRLIGVEYTMADKEAESVPYISIEEATFLKRSFRYDEHIGAVVGPLESSSFDKMLTTCVRSASLCPEAHSICVIETAQREYFFYGKDVFDEKQAMFRRIVSEAGLEQWVRDSTFPAYCDLLREFWLRFGDEQSAVAAVARL